MVSATTQLKFLAPDGKRRIDGKSKTKAYALFERSFIEGIEVGTTKGLQQIHVYLFSNAKRFILCQEAGRPACCN